MSKSKKYSIKIPEDIVVIYSGKKKIVVFKGPIDNKSLKLMVKIFLNQEKGLLQVSQLSFLNVSNKKKKTLKALKGTTTALIKQIILEVSVLLHKKLRLIGVGYKLFPVDVFDHQLIEFKLGYSHKIYFKIADDLKISCFKATTLFVVGNSYKNISQILASIRLHKKPEPYKGKGVLYENEKILLKEGKKV